MKKILITGGTGFVSEDVSITDILQKVTKDFGEKALLLLVRLV